MWGEMDGGDSADELRGLILLDATLPKAWERVALLKFGERLGEPATHHVYLEVQGRCAHQPSGLRQPHRLSAKPDIARVAGQPLDIFTSDAASSHVHCSTAPASTEFAESMLVWLYAG